jgi:hypothetical protein
LTPLIRRDTKASAVQVAALRKKRGSEVMARDHEAHANLAAAVEKVRDLYEGREAIYIEKGAIRVRVSNIRGAEDGLIEAHMEEIPTAGLPIWIRAGGPFSRTSPLRWTIATSSTKNFSPNLWSSPPYVGWTLYFSPKLIEEVVELVSQFPENYYPQLGYRKVMTFISNQTLDSLQPSLRKIKPS